MKLSTVLLLTLTLSCSGCLCISNCVDLTGKWAYSLNIGDGDIGGEIVFEQTDCSFAGSDSSFAVHGIVDGTEVRLTFLDKHDQTFIMRGEGSFYDEDLGGNPVFQQGRVYGIYKNYHGDHGNMLLMRFPD